MPSPFPGMDPYLERNWLDVRADLVALARSAVNELLPEDLVARMNERRVNLGPEAQERGKTFITILDSDGETLVTVIEFLSPADKFGDGEEQYRRARDELMAAKVNGVEVDLVRQGAWRSLLAPVVVPAEANNTYRAVVRRTPYRNVELYPFSLRRALPKLSIPLRLKDPEIVLDLQALVDQAYRNGRYDRTDYSKDCRPPLEGEDALWADQILRAAGLR